MFASESETSLQEGDTPAEHIDADEDPPDQHDDPKAKENDTKDTSSTSKINPRLLEKFQALQKRREQVCRRSTEKRVAQLKTQVLAKVQEELRSEEDLAVLSEHDVDLPGLRQGRKRPLDSSHSEAAAGAEDTGHGSSHNEGKWRKVQGYIDINNHLSGVQQGRYAAKSGLEEQIDTAISEGDLETAEKLSDKLANRDFGKKIADAMDAMSYDATQKAKEEQIKAKQKKKLKWGFDHKQRWETKGNM